MSQTKINNRTFLESDVSYDDVQISIENTLLEKIDISISDELESKNTVQKLIDSLENNTNTIWKLNRQIEKLKDDNKSIERELWDKCEHEWKRDWDVAFDDRCKYFCKTCQLWRNRHLYH
jgi:hypothetical protein